MPLANQPPLTDRLRNITNMIADLSPDERLQLIGLIASGRMEA